MTDITTLKNRLVERTKELLNEYDNITSHMQPYDVSAFDVELNSAYSYYSLKHFDEDVFGDMIKTAFDLDLNDQTIKELLSEYISEYSRATIMVKSLRGYIRCNNIMTEVDNEGMIYDK